MRTLAYKTSMRDMKNTVVTVFGGTGFIGRHAVRELAKRGAIIKVATRVPERAYFLRPCGTVGQIVPVACNYGDPASIRAAVRGSDFVVNTIGILYEKKRGAFERAHTEIPRAIAEACRAEDVQRFVHISAMGCEAAASRYAKTKRAGERKVLETFPGGTILRPSVVFGPGDSFFSMFAELSRYTPVLPLIGGGRTKFQPVFVGDVADAVMAALTLPSLSVNDPRGRIYELAGPETMSFREIYERLFRATGRRRCLVSLPWGVARVQAAFMSLMPRPLLTPDQVQSLKSDNVMSDGALTLENLGIVPTALDMILPEYLECYRPGGRHGDKKAA